MANSRYLRISKGSWAGGLFLIGAGIGVLSSGIKNAPKLPSQDEAFQTAIRLAQRTGGGVLIRDGRYVVISGGMWGE